MKVQIDDLNRIHLIDDFHPYGSLIFDPTHEKVNIYQDSESQLIRSKFEAIDESVEFEVDELVGALKEIIELLEGREWQLYTS